LLALCFLVLFLYLVAINLRDTGLWSKMSRKLPPWLQSRISNSSVSPNG
jgi:hypothetical protein